MKRTFHFSDTYLCLVKCLTIAIAVNICGLGLAAENKSPKSKSRRILVIGDSLTEGYNLSREQSYPFLVEQKLAAKGYSDLKVTNGGVSGATSASAISRLKWHLRSKEKWTVLILALGANDGLRGIDPSATKTNLLGAIKLAKENNIQVLLAGMKVPPNYGQDYAKKFETLFTDLANQEKVPLIPFLLKDVGGEPSKNLPDGIHPNAEGYKIVADTVLSHLEPLL